MNAIMEKWIGKKQIGSKRTKKARKSHWEWWVNREPIPRSTINQQVRRMVDDYDVVLRTTTRWINYP